MSESEVLRGSEDVVIEAAADGLAGDIIFRGSGAELARIHRDGTGTGWPKVMGGSLAAIGAFNVKDATYGAKGDRQSVSDAAIGTGSAVLTSATGKFAAADVGKTISVAGAGAAAATLVTTILSFQSATQVTLAANASTTVAAALAKWATDDTAAIQAAITACGAAGGGTVYFPPGRYMVTGLTMSSNGVKLIGAAMGDTAGGGYGAMLIGFASMSAVTDLVSVNAIKCGIRELALSGDGCGRDVLRLSNTSQRFIGEDLYIQSAGVGNGITHGINVTSLTNKWLNVYVASNAAHGIVDNSSDTEWSNITTFQNGGDGFRCVGTAGNVVNLHTWGNTGAGISHQPGANGWRFANIYSETNTGDGIDFTTAIYNTYAGGVIRANAVGINVQTSSKRNVFADLQVYNNVGRGVWLQSGDYCTLDNLHCFDDQGGKTQTFGIDIAAGVVGTSIAGRLPQIADHVTGGLNDAGTATVINGEVTITKAADQSVTSSVAIVNDNDIALAMGAGEVWEIDGILFVEGSQIGDFGIRLSAPSLGSGFWQALGPAASAASTSADSINPLGQAFNTTQTLGMVGAGLIVPIPIRGLLTVGVAGGTFNLKWAQGTSDATATIVHAGSFLKFRRLK